MQATHEELNTLFDLQEAQRTILRSRDELEKLPQRKAIVDIRAKHQTVLGKIGQVKDLHSDAVLDLEQIEHEDADLVSKQESLQEKIDSAQGDYRNVGALAKDLDGARKRREKLAKRREEAQLKIAQIDDVIVQATAARDSLEASEAKLVDEFKQQGGALQARITKATEQAEVLSADLPEDLLNRFNQVAKRCGGIGIARLDDSGTCSACRNHIEENKLLQMKREAPLTTCPNCNRLLVLE